MVILVCVVSVCELVLGVWLVFCVVLLLLDELK